jgi:hypothetical protein
MNGQLLAPSPAAPTAGSALTARTGQSEGPQRDLLLPLDVRACRGGKRPVVIVCRNLLRMAADHGLLGGRYSPWLLQASSYLIRHRPFGASST